MVTQNDTQNTDNTLNETARGVDNFLRWSTSAMLRGGRVTKFKGIAASYSPELGLVSSGPGAVADGGRGSTTLSLARRLLRWSAAPVALLAAQSPAFAQDACVEGAANNFVCEDNGDPATVEQDLSGDGGDVVVTIEDGFEVDTSAGSGDGINISAANSVVITQSSGSSSIIGSGFGIDAYGIYNGIDITTGGDVTGLGSDGIYAGNDTSGDIAIDSRAGAVTGAGNGIYAGNNGTGSISVTTADVTGEGGAGIYANNSGVEITIDSSAGTVTGSYNGIYTKNYGSGDTTITSANVTGSANSGIYARNYDGSGALTIDSTAGTVTGADRGIRTINEGLGSTSITTADVTSSGAIGIDAFNAESAGDLIVDTSAGAVNARRVGVQVTSRGAGIVSVTTGNVTGNDGVEGAGITVDADTEVSSVSIDTTAGAVIGGDQGIDVTSYSAGETSIVTGDVTALNTGEYGQGIYVNQLGAGGVTIDSSNGTVSGADAGIEVRNSLGGDISITTAAVTGGQSYGIEATNQAGTGDLTINTVAGAVSSATSTGIRATNNGSGFTSVTTADVSGYGEGNSGIDVNASGSGVLVDTSAGEVTNLYNDGGDAVFVNNNGAGATTVITGNVISGGADGVFVRNLDAATTDLTINTTAGVVTGADDGIQASNQGTGATTVTTGDVTSESGDGVNVQAYADAGPITIDTSAGTVDAARNGIVTGSVSAQITVVTAQVNAAGGDGIVVNTGAQSAGVSVDSSAGAVTGSGDGIRVFDGGYGDTTITAGDIAGEGGNGILVNNGAASTALTIDTAAGTVTGADSGIEARNLGTGTVTITTAAVTGQSGNGVDAYNGIYGEELIIDTSAGAVEGALNGIRARNYGDGQNATITTADVTGLAADGINVRDDGEAGNGADISINTTLGTVTGAEDGIDAFNFDTGDLSIITGAVSGGSGYGIYAINQGAGTGDLTIDTTAGAVTSGGRGIDARNYGSGTTTITTGAVDGEGNYAIYAYAGGSTTDLTINTVAGTVTGRSAGITARSYGSGNTTITTGDVSSDYGSAVAAYNSGQDITIDTTAGEVTGDSFGVYLRNDGSGDAAITTGNVTASDTDGISTYSNFGSGSLTIDTSAGTVQGSDDGIEASHYSYDDLSITTADASGGEDGISVRSYGNTSINSVAGAVSGDTTGIDADILGEGGESSVAITTADVTSAAGDGINVDTAYGSGSITIDASAGAVTGANRGIYTFSRAYADGQSTTITTGDVTGEAGAGIEVREYGETGFGAGDITINSVAGTVSGATDAIDAENRGVGDLSITTANANSGNVGIAAENFAGTGDLTIDSSAGTVDATFNGIIARNEGYGSTEITTGDVIAREGSGEGPGIGILATHGATAQNLVIDSSAGSITSNSTGIYASNRGVGSLSITSGAIESTVGNGIFTQNSGTDLTVNTTAGAVTAAGSGIRATNNGSGVTTVTTASVTAADGDGINARNGATATDLTIDSSAGAVSGGSTGVDVVNNGTGVTRITTADVTGGDDAILLRSQGSDVFVDTAAGTVSGTRGIVALLNNSTGLTSIITGDVTSVDDAAITVTTSGTDLIVDTSAGAVTNSGTGTYVSGIDAFNGGTGSTVVTTADVSSENGFGVEVSNGFDATDLTIDTTAGAVVAGNDGIYVQNEGTGSTTITTGDVTAGGDFGIRAYSYGIDLIIDTTAGTVTAADDDAIYARNYGTGEVVITTAALTGGDYGVYAYNSDEGTNLTIDTRAGAVFGDFEGIEGDNDGSGSLTIITADVTGAGDEGIEAFNDGADLTINTSYGSVLGEGTGVFARNRGSGALSITTADVTGEDEHGIEVENDDGTDLIINTVAGSITGGENGILAENLGTGALSITTANVTGTGADYNGVDARNEGTDLVIDSSAGAVTGVQNGINALNNGTGDTLITTADVTGTAGDGIFSRNAETAGDTTINTTAGAVTGGQDGIDVAHNFVGSISITTAAVTGTAGNGIAASLGAEGGDLTIDTTAGAVSGGGNGISANNNGTGDTTITTANVTGADTAISANVANGDLVIDTSAGSISAGTNGIEIDHQGAGSVSVATANVTAQGGDGFSMVTGVDTLALDIDTSAGAVVGGNRGIYVNHAGSGDLTITVGNVTGESAEGILASTTQDSANIILTGGTGVESNVVGGTTGIALSTQGADITVSGLDSVTGQAGDGLNLVSNGGDIAVTDIGTITGLGGNGIFANADSGNITIDNVGFVGGITATGGIAIAAYADNGGSVTIGTSGVVSGETYGVDGSASGDVTIDTTNYGVTAAIGIRAVNSGASATSVTTADVTGTGGEGITASTAGTDLLVNTVAGTITTVTDGIVASNTGTGTTTVTTANVTGTTGDGIDADTAGNGLSIDSSAGAVTGGQYGISAVSYGSGTLSITAGDVTGEVRSGVYALNDAEDGDLVINTVAGDVSGGTEGIAAFQSGYGTGSLLITAANVTGGQAGLNATNYGNELSIDTTAGAVVGGRDGIFASNVSSSQGDLAIVTGDVTGTSGTGIYASESGEGAGTAGADIAIDSTLGTVTGGTTGIYARNIETGDLTITTAGVTGSSGQSIDAENAAGTGDLAIDSSAGSISGAISGILARNNGAGLTSIVTGDVAGADGAGIDAVNIGTMLAIDSSEGVVTGSTFGIFADQRSEDALTALVDQVTGGVGIDTNATSGSTVITLGTTAVVTGTSGFGIDARSTGGDITVLGSSGTVIGATDGIYVRPTDGDITISTIDLVEGQAGDGLDLVTQGGAITVTDIGSIVGTGGNGIFANASGGVVDVQTAGDITGSLAGVAATTTGAGTISLDLGGATNGTQNGVDVATEGGAVAISNSGTLSGGDFAVLASGPNTGSITLDNTGTLSSAIQFAAADDSFTNSGTFAASGTSDFGEGADLLDNIGTIAVTGTAQFDRLETLQSGGILSLADGAATGSFTTSGDFVGTGGDIILDVDFATGSVDQLIIEGAATGTSTIALNTISTGFVFNQEFLIVQAGEGTEATAFALADGQQITPFLNADLSFDAAANTFSFEVAISERVFEGTKIAENAQALWYRSADAWADHRANSRANSGASEGTPVWVVAYGASAKRDENFRDPAGLVLNDAVLDYSQDFFGVQTGVDYALNDALTLGVTGGFLNSTARQDVNGNRINFDALNIGLSASYAAGPFFADALVKFDSISGDLSDPLGAGFNGELDGQSFGLRAQAGYRFGDASFYVEPNVAFDLQKTDLDDLVIEGQTFEFDNVNGARGTAGIRFGGESNAGRGATIGYYLGANMVHEFDGKADVRFLVNGGSVDFQNNPIDTYGNLEAGVSVDNGGPLSGFLQVESDLSSDYQSFGGKVGVRLKF